MGLVPMQAATASTDIAKEYYNSAEDVLENIQYPEDDSSNYASLLSSALNSQQQAENMVEQGGPWTTET